MKPSDDAPEPLIRDLGRTQRVDVYADGQIVITIFAGERVLWHFSREARSVDRAESRPEKFAPPPAVQKIMREHLERATLERIDEVDYGHCFLFRHANGSARRVHFEHRAAIARAVLTGQKARDGAPLRIIAVVGPAKDPVRKLKKGQPYVAPDAADSLNAPAPAAPDAPAVPVAAASSNDNETKAARKKLRGEKKRLDRLLSALARDRKKLGEPEAHYADGEVLKGLLNEIAPGQRAVTDPHTGLVVTLDPARSARANLENIFRLAKRAKRGAEKIAARRAETIAQRERIEAFIAEHGDEPLRLDDVEGIIRQTRSGRATPGPRFRPKMRRPYRRFRRAGQPAILVGRSARDNDDLTFHVANGRDTWLHARGYRGSHVVIKSTVDALESETLIDAAHLAAHFSDARNQSHVEVTYTEKKHVRKPGKKSAPGLVLLSKERVVHINIDAGRIALLLGLEVDPDQG